MYMYVYMYTHIYTYMSVNCVRMYVFVYIFTELKDIYKQEGKHTQPPVSLEGQMLWREFYYTCSVTCRNYHKMEDNPICRQIPWGSLDDPVYRCLYVYVYVCA